MIIDIDLINGKPTIKTQYGDYHQFEDISDAVFQILPDKFLLIDKKSNYRIYFTLTEDIINIKGVTFTGSAGNVLKEFKKELISQVFTPNQTGIINQKGFEVAETVQDIDTDRKDYRDVYIISENKQYLYKGQILLFEYKAPIQDGTGT